MYCGKSGKKRSRHLIETKEYKSASWKNEAARSLKKSQLPKIIEALI
jgi:hypothetical protein